MEPVYRHSKIQLRIAYTRCFAFLSALFFPAIALVQQVSIVQQIPVSIGACGADTAFTVELTNNTGQSIDSIIVTDSLPLGLIYTGNLSDTGATVSEKDTSNPGSPVFIVGSLAANATMSISFNARAGCSSQPGNKNNMVFITWYKGGTVAGNNSGIKSILVQVPSLVIGQIFFNEAGLPGNDISAAVDSVFARDIFIVNTGSFKVDSFFFKEQHDYVTVIDSVLNIDYSQITYDSASGMLGIFIGSSDVPGGLLPGDTFIVKELVRVVACDDGNGFGQSHFTVKWGCYGSICASTTNFSDVTVPQTLTFDNRVETVTDFCYGTDNLMEHTYIIRHKAGISNSIAKNLSVRLFNFLIGQSHTQMLPDSFQILLPGNIVPVTASPDSLHFIKDPNGQVCGLDSTLFDIFFSFDELKLSDSIVIYFKTSTCLPKAFNKCGGALMGSINGTVSSYNACGDFAGTLQNGLFALSISSPITADAGLNSPTDMLGELPSAGMTTPDSGGVIGLFDFPITAGDIQPLANWLRKPPDQSGLEVRFDLPRCLYPVDSDAINFWWASVVGNDTTWVPYYLNYDAANNRLIARLLYSSKPSNLGQPDLNSLIGSTVYILLKSDCRVGNCPPKAFINLKIGQISDTLCSDSVVPMMCSVIPVNIHCPGCLRIGMTTYDFDIKRISLGLADNNNDRKPDLPLAPPDPNLINTKRAMFGDTIEGHLTTAIHIAGFDPAPFAPRQLIHGYYHLTIENADKLTPVNSRIEIWDNSATQWRVGTIPGSSVSTTSGQGDFFYDFSIDSLGAYGIDTSAFSRFDDGDSVHIFPTFRITGNIGNTTIRCNADNHAYVAVLDYTKLFDPVDEVLFKVDSNGTLHYDPADPMFDSIQYYCEDYGGFYFLAGFAYDFIFSPQGGFGDCGQKVIVGAFAFNMGGIFNAFPFEFRNWSHTDTFWLGLPPGFKFDFLLIHDPYINGFETFQPGAIYSLQGDSLIISFANWFAQKGYTHYFDDNYSTGYQVGFHPDCQVPHTPYPAVIPTCFKNDVVQSAYLSGVTVPGLGLPQCVGYRFYHPSLARNITGNSIIATEPEVSWPVVVSLPSTQDNQFASPAKNVWVGFQSLSGTTTISTLILTQTGDTISPVGGGDIFPLGDIAAGSSVGFTAIATYTDCAQNDTILLFTGWDCVKYPSGLDSLFCTHTVDTLILSPRNAAMQVSFAAQGGAFIELCDSINYTIAINSTLQGTMGDLTGSIVFPAGVVFVDSSLTLEFKGNTAAVSAAVANGIASWDSLPLGIDTNGLKSGESAALHFYIYPGCNYDSSAQLTLIAGGITNCSDTIADTLFANLPQFIFPSDTLLLAPALSPSAPACGQSSHLTVTVTNPDGGTINSNSLFVTVPVGLDTSAVQPPPDSISTGAQEMTLVWNLPPLGLGGTLLFELNLSADSGCSDFVIRSSVFTVDTFVCAGSGITCPESATMTLRTDTLHICCQPPVSVTASSTGVLCNGDSTGTATATVSGGLSPYTFLWSNGATQSAVGNLQAGTYTVTVTDSNNSTATASVTITQPSALTAAATATAASCLGGNNGTAAAAAAGGSSPYTFTWSNGSSQSAIGSLQAGNYTVTATDANGCTATANVAVGVSTPLPVASFTFNEFDNCEEQSVSFTSTSTNTTTYKWNFGDNTGNFFKSIPTISHTFTLPGYYLITHTAKNSCGEAVSTDIIYIIPSTTLYNNNCCISTFQYSNNIPGNAPNSNNITINGATTWTTSMGAINIKGTLTIDSGASLYVNPGVIVGFGPQGKVIVKQGGTLTLDGATFTSINYTTCSPATKMMWFGIEVWGNNSNSSAAAQGKIVLQNNAFVEDAHNGVTVGKWKLNATSITSFQVNGHEVSEGGGVIQATNSNFNRNARSIMVWEQNNFSSPSKVVINCKFTCNNNGNKTALFDPYYNEALPNSYYFFSISIHNPFFLLGGGISPSGQGSKTSIILIGVKQIILHLNNFNSTITAIESADSRYNVTNSTFNDCIFSVSCYNVNSGYFGHTISNNVFKQYQNGIVLVGIGYNKVMKNVFNPSFGLQSENRYAINLVSSSNFSIVDNEINRNIRGIYCENSVPNLASLIGFEAAGNTFTRCLNAIETNGANSMLTIRCNSFNNSLAAEYIKNWDIYNSTIPNQGQFSATDQKKPAGNRFSISAPGIRKEIKTTIPFYYYAHSAPADRIPVADGPVNIDSSSIASSSFAASCTPAVPPGCKPCNIQAMALAKVTIQQLQAEYNSVQSNLDKGQTSQLLTAINHNKVTPAGILKNMLLAASPLSDTVLIAFINRTVAVTPPGIFKDVIIPNSPVSAQVMAHLEPKLTALPPGIAQQIRDAQAVNPGYRTLTAIQRDITQTEISRQLSLNDLIHTYSEEDSLLHIIQLLEEEQTTAADQLLTGMYLADSNLIAAGAKLALLAANNTEDSLFKVLYGLYIVLGNAGKSYWDMDSMQLATVKEIAGLCPETRTVLNARAVLGLVTGDTIPACANATPTLRISQKKRESEDNIMSKETLNKYGSNDFYLGNNIPNPFSSVTQIPYYIPENSTSAFLKITDLRGHAEAQYTLAIGKGVAEINLNEFQNGIYFYSLVVDGTVVQTKRMTIIKQ